MASSGYYSHSNSAPKHQRESNMGVVVPGAWPMSQPSYQNSNSTISVQRRNSPSKGPHNGQKLPRPMSMPSHHFHAHAHALATLNSYCLEADDVIQYVSPPPSGVPPPRASVATTESIPTPPPSCAPWIPKVKAIKKLQSKIGIGSEDKTLEQMMNNGSPLRFHSVHGDNIQLFQGGNAVRRLPSITHSYCKAIVFSDRPVKVNERVCVKVIGSSTEFAGGIRFGFTNQNPNTLRYSLPDRAIPELAKRQGFWAKALLADNLLKNEAVLFYYVNPSGKVRYGINGKKVGTFLKYVDTRRPLWALLDVYGNTTAIELVDPKAHLNNSRKSLEEFNKNIDDVDSALGPSMNSLNIRSEPHIIPTKLNQPPVEPEFNNLQLHPICGRNVQLNKFRNAAWRNTDDVGNAYIFTSRPLNSGETIVIQVQQCEETNNGSMAFGFTSADPNSINPKSLPDDSYYLVDRPEYWIFKKDAVNNLESGDELAFTLTSSGAVNVSKNGGQLSTLMYVDNSAPLWAFFDLFGSTYKLALIGSIPSTKPKSNTLPQDYSPIIEAKSLRSTSLVQQRVPVTPSNFTSSPSRVSLRQSPHSAGCKNSQHHLREGRSLSLSPKKTKGINMNQMEVQVEVNFRQQVSDISVYAPLNVKKMDQKPETTTKCQSPKSQCKNNEVVEKKNWSVDCVACCRRPVNSLFSPCGHLTMCYECAYEYWNSHQSTCCPICRAQIADVIRVSKSSS